MEDVGFEQAASAIKRIYNRNPKNIFLCHLSENNNTPERAFNEVARGLAEIGVKVGTDVTPLTCLPRKEVSTLYTF
ncbi:MAG: hypothetical protein RR555_03740 [Bacteroidales bacterium]